MNVKKLVKLTQIDAYSKAVNSINNLYETESGKKFIHHLIYSFIKYPGYHIVYSKTPILDCITGSVLNTIYQNRDEVPTDILELMNNKDQDETKFHNDLECKLKLTTEFKIKNRLAIRSDKSNKMIGADELTALSEFTESQISIGNPIISSMLGRVKKVRNKRIFKHKSKSTKVTFGSDLNLRSKLESVLSD